VALLSGAAALYVVASGPDEHRWHPAALELLISAGVDVEQAEAVHRARLRIYSGSLR
jgi:hypothetical protein